MSNRTRSSSDPTFSAALATVTAAKKVADNHSSNSTADLDHLKNDDTDHSRSGGNSSSTDRSSSGNSSSTTTTTTTTTTTEDKHDAYTVSLEQKLQRMQENNAWNSEIENIVKNIGEQAAGYQWMHSKAADFLGKISTWLTMSYIIFNAFATFFLSTSLIAQLEAPWIYIPVGISAVVNIVLTILAAAIKAMGIEDRVSKHKDAMSKFTYLYLDTRKELSFYRRNRKPGPQYLDLVAQKFDFYILAGPDIPGRIESKYLKILKQEGRRLAVVGKISHEIEIQQDDEEQQQENKKKHRNHRRRRRRRLHHRERKKDTAKKSPAISSSEDEKPADIVEGSMIYEMHRRNEAESDSECESEPEGTSIQHHRQQQQRQQQQQRHISEAAEDRYARFQIDRFY